MKENKGLSASLPGGLNFGVPGKDGATFTPSLDDDGNLSWSNDKDLPNPEPKNIRGPQGPAGEVSDDKIAEAVKEYLDSGGNVNKGWTTEQVNLLDQLFNYIPWTSSDAGAIADSLIASLRSDDTGGGEDEPDEPVTPEKTLTSISATYSGGDVAVGTAVTALTGVVVTAHYSDGTSEPVTGYTLSGTIAEGSNAITVSYGGKTTTFTVTGVAESSGDIPADATRLAYIESTGTQYIDTGVQIHWDNDLYMNADTSGITNACYLFGAKNGTVEVGIYPYIMDTITKLKWPGNGANANNAQYIGQNVEINVRSNGATVIFTSSLGGDTTMYIGSDEHIACEAGTYLFAFNENGAANMLSSYKLREFILYTDNTRETEIIHLIPVRDPDGVACMYDTVSKQYFRNAGTGEFVGGEN